MASFPRRRIHVLEAAVLGMSILGAVAMTTAQVKIGWATEWAHPGEAFLELVVCATIGAFVGLLSSPVVMACLYRKDLRIALTTVYGISALAIIPYTYFEPMFWMWPLDSAFTAFISVCVLSVVVRLVIPDSVAIDASAHCPRCDYDLRGGCDENCPECGWRRRSY
jgi:hypothetical protein